ncbi:MAG: SDR family oxidoreductase [bacterium]|nr:SDR family oxidoreductase [bacterium]
MKLKNKIVIITGSSSGIGRATALRFAQEGAKVVVNSKSTSPAGEAVVADITSSGNDAMYVSGDVSNPDEVTRLFDETVSHYGTIDILINNAGRHVGYDFLTASKDDFLESLSTNLVGTMLCSQKAAQLMLKQGSGKILNTASEYGLEYSGEPTGVGYSAAKAGVINFTRTLAKLLSPKIQVNAVAPGYVYVPHFADIPDQEQKEMINEMKLGRWITVEEIAEAFLYLATADAITGEVLVVDGGFQLK